ncbi:MAG: alpha/beta hydrolase [Caldilineaceae bacterium]|nr:alpha/beta hydrolase [Caldilineaceae bacterium]HRJ44132.1 alpha/beta hydrolase [Caldilineaceae bacterium]
MNRRIISSIGALLLVLAGVWAFINRGEISFYWNLFQVDRAGKQFYAEYPHLARDVQYSPRFGMGLDVYSPAQGENHPVLIFIHGGGWDKYDRKLFTPVGQKFVEMGIVVVIPDYTLHPDAGYKQMTQEMAAATAWTLENIAQYGGDPSRVVIAGHSAGAHLAGLVATDEVWLNFEGHTNQELCGFIGLSGVYDIPAQMVFERSTGGTAPVMTAVMGGEANFAVASPSSYLFPSTPQTLLVHGALDDTVPLSISENFQRKLDAAGIPNRLVVYPDKGHNDYLFDGFFNATAPILIHISDFAQGCFLDVG